MPSHAKADKSMEGVESVAKPNSSQPPNYTVKECRLGTPRRLRIVAIGAGASGLNLLHKLQQHTENIEYVVYEKNVDVGGTWFENRYPGCACDIPSHNYQFAWEPNPNWSTL